MYSHEHEYWVLDWWCLWAKRLVSLKLSFRNKTLKYNRGDEIQIGPIISKALVNFGLVWKLFCELTLFNSIQFYSTFISFKQMSRCCVAGQETLKLLSQLVKVNLFYNLLHFNILKRWIWIFPFCLVTSV